MAAHPPNLFRRASDWYGKRSRRWSTALYALLLLVGSLLPPRGFPGILDWSALFSRDKIAHFGAYAVFTLLLSFSLPALRRGKNVLRAIVLATAFGALMELLQGISGTGRDADPIDMAANALGALLGGLTAWGLHRLSKRSTATAAPPDQ